MRHSRTTTRSIAKVVAATAAICVIASACGSSSSGGDEQSASTTTTAEPNALTDEGTPVEGGNLTIAVESETPGWNPATNIWTLEGNLIGSSMLEPLTVINSKGEVVPWLAESFEANENSTVWTITLRKGITFQDGEELNAQAAVESLEFQNSDDALASIIIKELIGTLEVVDEYTFRIPVNIQWGAFPSLWSSGYGYMMAPSMLAKPDQGSATGPIGTGAFKFDKLEKDRHLRVSRNDSYWGGPCAVVENPDDALTTLCEDLGAPLGRPNGPFLDSMEFRPIPDSVQRQQALEAGDVDLILNTRPGITASLRPDFQVITDYSTEQNFVQLQTAQAPFDELDARLALAYATDRVRLVETLGGGEEIPVDTSPFEETSPWGGIPPDETNYPLYNVDKAKEALAAYTEKTGEPTLAFTLLGSATLDDLEVMQALVDMWAEVGIEAKIDSVKKEALVGLQVGGDFQAVVSRNYSFADPDSEYQFWADTFAAPPIALNFNQWYNDKTQAALDLGRESSDPVFRKQAYDSFVLERNENAPDIWLFNMPWAMIGDKDIGGLNPFRNLGIAGYYAKPWVQALWVAPAE